MRKSKLFLLALAVIVLSTSLNVFGAATITIVNGNAPGVGFNDPTPAAPVGGNAGTTLGQQRLNAFQFAANVWGSTLDSKVEIRILATFEPLSCTTSSAVLGSAGTMVMDDTVCMVWMAQPPCWFMRGAVCARKDWRSGYA